MNARAKALEVFGADRQVDKCIEELGELVSVLIQHRNGRRDTAAVVDELADVLVTVRTLALHFGKEAVDARIQVKLARLSRLCADQVQATVATAKPEPKPRPALCWSPWQGGHILQVNGRWLGSVSARDTMWLGNSGDRGAGWYKTVQEAMRAVELHHGLDEVPLWP